MTNHIENAVEPLRSATIEKAEKVAREVIAKTEAELAAVDYDLDKIANTRDVWDRRKYNELQGKRYLVNSMTEYDRERLKKEGFIGTASDPHYVKFTAERAEKFLQEVRENASAQYDAFIEKLNSKAGDGVIAAELQGSHVWGYSILTVTKGSGEVTRWKTQQIVNVSKLGKLFNQWPTRKVK